jgi:hypothetical protein
MLGKYGGFRMSVDDRWKYVVMGGVTENPQDPRVAYGSADEEAVPQNEVYLVLPEAERIGTKVRPLRDTYQHKVCGKETTTSPPIAQSFACNPKFYQLTYCITCMMHRPVSEFLWVEENGDITDEVGS